MADEKNLKINNISYVTKAGMGIFKATADQFGWKRSGQTLPEHLVQYAGKEISSAEWQNASGSQFVLKLSLKQEGADQPPLVKFSGFDKKDFDRLKAHFSNNFSVELKEVVVSTLGCSWGEVDLEDDVNLRIMTDGKLGFEVPISSLGQVTAQGKADLNLELQELTDGPEDEVLHEIRLQVVPERLSAETLQLELQQKAGLSERGEALARISDVMLIAPRGKHDLEFFKQALKVHGKTQTYTVQYRSIARLFLMSIPGDGQIALVIGLDQPLRSGTQQVYFLVFTVAKDLTMVPNLPEDKLKEYSMAPDAPQAVYGIIARLLKDLSGKPVTAPASDLKTRNGAHCVRCSHKASPGFLFPMKKSLMFIVKPVVWLRYDEIDEIEFVKGMSRARSFDLKVHVRGKPEVEFLQIDAEDRLELIKFLQTVNVRLINAEIKDNELRSPLDGPAPSRSRGEAAASKQETPEGAPEDEEDDEDFEDGEGGSSSEGSEDELAGDDDSESDSEAKPKKRKTK